PDQYPLSLNGVVVGCNQKSNRDPVMTVDEEQVMRAIDGLKKCGAAAVVFGSGTIPRSRHLAYEWLGVGKEELAIMGELLLRGEQTEGDLRGRASRSRRPRSTSRSGIGSMRLAERGLVVWLSPPGRGRMLTHGLLPEEKLDKVRRELGLTAAAAATAIPEDRPDVPEPAAAREPTSASPPRPAPTGPSPAALEQRLIDLEATVAELQKRLAALEQALGG
ncbi:MAG: DUF480 domain-containing protein, partial [Planctomycetota bacterium]